MSALTSSSKRMNGRRCGNGDCPACYGNRWRYPVETARDWLAASWPLLAFIALIGIACGLSFASAF